MGYNQGITDGKSDPLLEETNDFFLVSDSRVSTSLVSPPVSSHTPSVLKRTYWNYTEMVKRPFYRRPTGQS